VNITGDFRMQAEPSAAMDERLSRIEEGITGIMATQEEINAKLTQVTGQIDAATKDIKGDIDRLKQQIASGVNPDFSALDARVNALQGLAAENVAPPATPAAP
jgi:archaellum component FlaC